MSLLDIILFGNDRNSKKRVTAEEYKKVRSHLHSVDRHQFTDRELGTVDMLFQTALHEKREIDRGIDSDEITTALTWLRQHPHEHTLSPEQQALLEATLREYL